MPSGYCAGTGQGQGSRHSSGRPRQGGPVPRTGFEPSVHGFHFANDFVDKIVTIPGFGEVATDGRSGGMAYAALDYWFAGLPVPTHRPADFPDRAVPEDGSRLADYLYKRLFDSFATWSARQFVTWSLAADHPTWSYQGVTAWTREVELPRLRRSIEAGRPVVLGLVAARGLAEVARNRRDYRAPRAGLRRAVRGPAGENLDRYLGGDGDATPLEPGEERALFKSSDAFGTVAGSYLIVAGYRSEAGRWLTVPPGEPGVVDQVGVTVVPPLRRTRVTLTFTELVVEDAAALAGRLGLRLAAGELTARWPEEGLAEVEDGKAFDVSCRFDLVQDPGAVLEVSLSGSGADERPGGVVREPYSGLVDWGRGEHRYRSRLPGDGGAPGPDAEPGAFTIAFRIEVTPLD